MASDLLVSETDVTSAWPQFGSQPAAERARLIRMATRTIEAYVGRQLGLGDVTEIHRPGNSRVVYLRVTPVNSIASVAYGNPATTLDTTFYSLLDAGNGVVELYRSFPGGYRFPDRAYGGDPRSGSLEIVYSGGWATADVPDNVKQAAIIVIRFSVAQGTVEKGGYYESVQQGSYSYKVSQTNSKTTTMTGLPAEALGYLRYLKKARIA
jgi:hypothetical protein